MNNTMVGDGAQVKIYYGTGPAPANGAALTGTQKGSPSQVDYFPTASKNFPFSVLTVITGLTLSITYWFDLALAAVTGGTAVVSNLEVVIFEF